MDQKSTRPGQEGPIQYLVGDIFIAASRGPGIIRVVWRSCHFGVVWAHLQWPTEDAGRHVVGLGSMVVCFVLSVECGFHKHRKFVKSFWCFVLFC
jgi:hypothetical protein